MIRKNIEIHLFQRPGHCRSKLSFVICDDIDHHGPCQNDTKTCQGQGHVPLAHPTTVCLTRSRDSFAYAEMQAADPRTHEFDDALVSKTQAHCFGICHEPVRPKNDIADVIIEKP
jgi:hypothetical protein